MSQKIFINYRKEDSPWNSIALYSELIKHFPEEDIFKDFNTIKPGYDFVESIEEALQTCDVLLVLISESWLEMRDKNGNRRIDDPDDFVRIEIATALKRKIPVIPILFDNAIIPRVDELPEDLKALSRRQVVEMTRKRFASDALTLVQAIKKIDEKNLPMPGTGDPVKVTDFNTPVAQKKIQFYRNKKIIVITAIAFSIFAILLLFGNKILSFFNTPGSDSSTTVNYSEMSLLTLPETFSIDEESLKRFKDYGELDSLHDVFGDLFNYKGGVLNGKPEGYGYETYIRGDKYEGNHKNGVRSGKGKYLEKTVGTYTGEWKNDKAEGNGTYVYLNGNKYIGEWKNDKQNGKGIFYYANGDKYTGTWKDDEWVGEGTFTWNDGVEYKGFFKNEHMDGYGEIFTAYNQEISNCPKCRVYKGHWKNGLKSGSGSCYDEHGNLLYVGPFKNDRPVNKYPSK